MAYERVDRVDLTDGVARQLRTAILKGDHQPGAVLPPERDLATQFGVDRHTLRSALTELEHLGLVQRRQGSGCRVLDFRETGTLELIKYLVVAPGTDHLDPAIVGSAIEVGRLTFQSLMDLVVNRADRGDFEAMTDALDALAAAIDSGDASDIVDVERGLVRRIFYGAHSPVAELLVNTYAQIFDAALDPEGRARLQWGDPAVSSGRIAKYQRVLDAIEQRDATQARQLVEVILAGIPDAMTSTIAAPATRRHPPRTGTE